MGVCLEQFVIAHSASPLAALRNQGIQADDFPAAIGVVAVDEARMQPLEDFGGLLWIDGDRLVADARMALELTVVDGTRLRAGDCVEVAKLAVLGRAMPPRAMARLLLEAGIIRTYWHLESSVCLERESEAAGAWEGTYSGMHVYFTDRRNTGRFAFSVRIDSGGTVTATGR